MVTGDQWKCWCGTSNFFLRKRCRDCGITRDQKLADEPWYCVGEPTKETSNDASR